MDLKTGWVYTYLNPPEDIEVSHARRKNLTQNSLKVYYKANMMPVQCMRRNWRERVKKIAGPADVMDRGEAEYKICQFCQLWILYADNSVELKRKSELSHENAVAAWKVYVPYIWHIIQQLDEVMKISAMEKELRSINYFPVPQITPQDSKIETT